MLVTKDYVLGLEKHEVAADNISHLHFFSTSPGGALSLIGQDFIGVNMPHFQIVVVVKTSLSGRKIKIKKFLILTFPTFSKIKMT